MAYTKLRCAAFCTLTFGVLFLLLAGAWIPLLTALMKSGAKQGSALTLEN